MYRKPYTFARSNQTVRNRTVLAAMTNKQSNADGSLGEDELRWLLRRALGSFGIVTTCAAHVSLDGQGWDGELGVFDDALLPGLTRLAETLREARSMNLVQIFHGGTRSPSRLTQQQPLSASVYHAGDKGFEAPREATGEDIARLIEAFAAAAARCERAGFDGVEIHGAHGYLITQFLGKVSNTRTDAWGGSLERRARFLLEIIEAVKAATSPEFVVGVRLSRSLLRQGLSLEESLEVATMVGEAGVDFVHGSFWHHTFDPVPDGHPMLTTRFRDALPGDCALIVTGSLWTPDEVRAVMDQGADLVGMAKAAIANPDWPRDAALDPNYTPLRPPYAAEDLEKVEVSKTLVEYLRNWEGFVKE